MAVLLACCALSSTSPCGPSGLRLTVTTTRGLSPRDFGKFGAPVHSNPRLLSSRISVFEAWVLRTFSLLPTTSPVGGGGCGPLIKRYGVGSRTFHPAICKVEAISDANVPPSVSPLIKYTLACTPENLLSRVRIANRCCLVILRHATDASISTRASLSSSASLPNRAASFSFAEARSSAALASLLARPTKVLVVFLISDSILPALMCIQNSPATPIATNPAPNKPRTNKATLGFSEGWTTPDQKSRSSCKYSVPITPSSTTTPSTTRSVQKFNHASSDAQDFSRLSSALARAEASMNRFRESELRAVIIQIVALGVLLLITIGMLSFCTSENDDCSLA